MTILHGRSPGKSVDAVGGGCWRSWGGGGAGVADGLVPVFLSGLLHGGGHYGGWREAFRPGSLGRWSIRCRRFRRKPKRAGGAGRRSQTVAAADAAQGGWCWRRRWRCWYGASPAARWMRPAGAGPGGGGAGGVDAAGASAGPGAVPAVSPLRGDGTGATCRARSSNCPDCGGWPGRPGAAGRSVRGIRRWNYFLVELIVRALSGVCTEERGKSE